LIVTGAGQLLFHDKANGSILLHEGKAIGSMLIGQQFEPVKYFSSRPSATNYQTLPSGGSNLGITNKKLQKLVTERKSQFLTVNQLDEQTDVPSEMLFASGSGLDPHISPKAALLQVERIVKSRQFDSNEKQLLLQSIAGLTQPPQYLILGEQRINVLMLNLKLDEISKNYKP
jgi:K+-transporting ATPase ATPase C chain